MMTEKKKETNYFLSSILDNKELEELNKFHLWVAKNVPCNLIRGMGATHLPNEQIFSLAEVTKRLTWDMYSSFNAEIWNTIRYDSCHVGRDVLSFSDHNSLVIFIVKKAIVFASEYLVQLENRFSYRIVDGKGLAYIKDDCELLIPLDLKF
ncbi:MAG: hypothetical protein V3V61_03930 [Gammaproteobacteria bacterium]